MLVDDDDDDAGQRVDNSALTRALPLLTNTMSWEERTYNSGDWTQD